METPALYRAEGLAPLVSITDDGRLLATLDEVMLGWNVEFVDAPEPGQGASMQVVHGADGWTISGETYEKAITFRDPVAAACSLIAGLYKIHTLVDLEGLYMHAAGVRISGAQGDGLVLLTGHYRAGKSVVTAACAAAGLQVFSDDIIPVDPGGRIARAPGLAIRLRLPLPESFAEATRDFVDQYRIASSERYLYIRPPEDRLALRGAEAPIRGVVSLSRIEGAEPRLTRLGAGDALSAIIRRNFAREVPAGQILDAFDGLIGEVPALRLTYDRADEAVCLLREAFEATLPEMETAPATEREAGGERSVTPLPADTVLHRQAGAHARERDGQVFLTDADEWVIFNLNPIGAAVWRVLEQPTSFGELAAIFYAGFPDRDPEELTADLARLVRDLASSGLVRIDRAAEAV